MQALPPSALASVIFRTFEHVYGITATLLRGFDFMAPTRQPLAFRAGKYPVWNDDICPLFHIAVSGLNLHLSREENLRLYNKA